MMVMDRATGALSHARASDLPRFLRPGDVTVLNNTRVIPARLFGTRRDSGGRAEVLLVEETGPGVWACLCRASGRMKPGIRLLLAGGIEAETLAKRPDGSFLMRLTCDRPVSEAIEQAGVPPLPPYIKRARPGGDGQPSAGTSRDDRERYQTVYAKEPGAVAAPTAGLHFDGAMLERIRDKGIGVVEVTLHVGPGTFRPVKSEVAEEHVMDEERYQVSQSAAEGINAVRERGGRVVAVGTTVVRTLETVAGPDGRVRPGSGRTALYILPPYRFRAVDALLTNFHLPRSTLLMMVCAFAGQTAVLEAYRQAVRDEYRFYSYGDCMLIV